MKKIYTVILGITLAYSCSTNSDNNQNVANYNGTYIGNVNVYLNNNRVFVVIFSVRCSLSSLIKYSSKRSI